MFTACPILFAIRGSLVRLFQVLAAGQRELETTLLSLFDVLYLCSEHVQHCLAPRIGQRVLTKIRLSILSGGLNAGWAWTGFGGCHGTLDRRHRHLPSRELRRQRVEPGPHLI